MLVTHLLCKLTPVIQFTNSYCSAAIIHVDDIEKYHIVRMYLKQIANIYLIPVSKWGFGHELERRM